MAAGVAKNRLYAWNTIALRLRLRATTFTEFHKYLAIRATVEAFHQSFSEYLQAARYNRNAFD